MNRSALLHKLLAKIPTTTPPQFLLIAAPLTIVLLGILVVAFQINRQLYDQQQVIVGRLAHAAVRHTAQLQREHLRLYAMVEGTDEPVDEAAFQLQRDLVQSRIQILHNTLLTGNASQDIYMRYHAYVDGWQLLQPQIVAWKTNPQDAAHKNQVTALMTEIELHVNHISTLAQLAFEDSMEGWASKSHFLNRLLTLGSFSFILIIILMTYASYLFYREQAANEQILRNSEQRLRVILDAIPDAVYRLSGDGIFRDYKPAANETHCLPKGIFHHKHLTNVWPTAVAELIQHGIQTVLTSGEQLLLEYSLKEAESTLILHYEARLLPSGTDEVQIIVRDITRVKEEEDAARQAQKLESLGVLAGGIAHDFNNLLTGMLAQASLAVAKLTRGLPAIENVQKIVLAAERAADLTRQLLAYTGKGKFQISPLDLNQLIRDTTNLMGTALPSSAALTMELQEGLPFVQVDRVQIQQVVMNLFINAIEALIEGKGSITIRTSTRYVDSSAINNPPILGSTRMSPLDSGVYVAVTVTDTGTGMDQATLSRIFDPFFSTKPKGHGLGLSATLGIIRTHQGALQVQSHPGTGTTFTMLLPAYTEAHVAQEKKMVHIASPVAKQQKAVLVIDDEAHVREAATDILLEQGLPVRSAANGQAGIEEFRANNQTIGVVLLDLKMPGMSGKETYQGLQQIQPDLKVIFTSGYTESEVATQIHESHRITFLPKPYTADMLTKEVCQMLLRE